MNRDNTHGNGLDEERSGEILTKTVPEKDPDTSPGDKGGVWRRDEDPRSEEGKSRDYPALASLAVIIAALIVSGVFSVIHLSKGGTVIPEKGVLGWVEELERYGRDLLSRIPGGIISGEDRVQEAKRHVRNGYQLFTKNRLGEALEEYGKATRLDPSNPESFYLRGRVFLKSMRYDEALEDFRTAARLKPDYKEAHDHLGWIYEKKAKDVEAISHYTKSIELDQKNGWAFYHRAIVRQRKGETEKALEDARKACELKFQDACRLYDEYKKKSGNFTNS